MSVVCGNNFLSSHVGWLQDRKRLRNNLLFNFDHTLQTILPTEDPKEKERKPPITLLPHNTAGNYVQMAEFVLFSSQTNHYNFNIQFQLNQIWAHHWHAYILFSRHVKWKCWDSCRISCYIIPACVQFL